VTYRITAEGKERLAELLGDAGPQSWSDDGFGVHLAFFSRTSSEARMRILEGRRRRVEERREERRSAVTRAAERLDTYTAELHQLGLEASDREVRWLNELIAQERNLTPTSVDPTGTAGPAMTTEPSTDPGSGPPEPSADPGSDPPDAPSARDMPTDRPAR
jgi:DNA-binding PadR family transcriptional regulator